MKFSQDLIKGGGGGEKNGKGGICLKKVVRKMQKCFATGPIVLIDKAIHSVDQEIECRSEIS